MMVLSYGGGVQSTTLLALALSGHIEIDGVIYVDLGRAESPETRAYALDYALPRAAAAGLRVAASTPQTLYEDMLRKPSFVPVPFRVEGALLKRQCTYRYKIIPFRRLLRAMYPGVSRRNPCVVALGYTIEELARMRDPDVQYYRHVYPLIDLRMTRHDCIARLRSEGWCVPPKSSCWFCPFRSASTKRALAEQYPDVARGWRELDAHVNGWRARHGKDAIPIIEIETDERQSCMWGACEF